MAAHEVPHDPGASDVGRILPGEGVVVTVGAGAVNDLRPPRTVRPDLAGPPVHAVHVGRVIAVAAAAQLGRPLRYGLRLLLVVVIVVRDDRVEGTRFPVSQGRVVRDDAVLQAVEVNDTNGRIQGNIAKANEGTPCEEPGQIRT